MDRATRKLDRGQAGKAGMNAASKDIAEYVRLALQLHGLEVDDARRAAITKQFEILTSMAELFLSEADPSETSTAPIYRL